MRKSIKFGPKRALIGEAFGLIKRNRTTQYPKLNVKWLCSDEVSLQLLAMEVKLVLKKPYDKAFLAK